MSMTKRNAEAWAAMGISKDWQIVRLTEWAQMLEDRLKQLDPNYETYPFGRTVIDDNLQVIKQNNQILLGSTGK